MKGKSIWLLLPCILLLAASPALAAPPNWVQVTPTNDSMFVFGTVTVSVNRIPVSQSTSLLGAFVPGLATPDTVVGITNFAGNPGEYSMPIYGNDTTTAPKDGANNGDNVTFQLYYAPEDQLLSSYTFTATDELGNPLSAVQYVSFGFDNVTINFNMDLRPVWDNLAVFSPKSVNEGANLQFTAHATDPDGTTVTLAANNLPGFCTHNATSGLVNCNPTFADNAVYNVTFRASSAGLFALPDNAAVAITVNNVNRAPVFNTITPATDVSGPVGSTFTKAFTFSDPDGDAIAFLVDVSNPLPPFCSLTGGTAGSQSITCSPVNPVDQGTYLVKIRIRDNGTPAPLDNTHSFNVVVTNRAPVVSGLSNAAYDNNSAALVTQPLSVTDADGNAIVASVCTMTPSKPWFAFDNLRLTAPRITIQGPMPAGDVGPYTINCASTDDGTPPAQGTASATLIISSDPTWSPVPGNQGGSENTPFTFTVQAFDAFGGTIVYSATGLPATCSLNTSTGQVSCTPDFASSGVSNAVFRAQVTTGANAGKFAAPDNAAVAVTVANVNRAPAFNTITPAGDVSGPVGSTLTKTFTYSDPDGDTIAFDNVAPLPSFCTTSGTGNARTITCLPTLPAHQGTFAVTARITDNGSPAPLDNTHTFNVVVTNRAPAISGLSNAAYDNNSTAPATQLLSVTDADGNAIVASVCTMTPSKSWFAFDNSNLTAPTITIQGPMPAADVRSYLINCASTDNGTPPAQGTASATLNISSDPIWSPVPGNQTGSEGTPFNFTVHAADPLGGTIVYSATGLPAFCPLNTSTGQVSCAPDFSASGTYNAVFRAQSTTGPSAGKFAAPDNAAVTITVNNVNRAPVFGTVTPAGNVNGPINTTFTKAFTYSDPDGDTIAFTTDAVLPSFCSVSGTGNSRTITCIPTLPAHQGTFAVTARITDNGSPAPLDNTHSFSIIVDNRPPTVSVSAATTADTGGGDVTIPVTFSDPDGNGIPVKSCTAVGGPSWFSFDAGTNTITVATAGITFANDIDTATGQRSYNFNCTATDNGTPATPAAAPSAGTVTLVKQPHFAATVTTTAQKVTFGGAVGKGLVPAVSGDEVYVYSVNPRPGTVIPGLKYDRKLVGHAFITSTGFSVDAYGDNPGTAGTIEGLVNGEEALFLLYSAADAKVYTAYKVNTSGWSLAWNDAIPSQTVTLDFIDGQRYPLVNGAWNLFGYGVMKGYSVGGAVPTAPQLSGLSTWASVADVGASEPLQSIANKYDRVIGNDGVGAKLWNPTAPRFSSLTYLAPGYGYWVKMKASTQKVSWITVPGTPATGTETMSLGLGWVLLSYPGQRVYVESGYDVTGDLLPTGAPSSTTLTPTGRMGDFWTSVTGNYDRATSFDANGTKLWSPVLPSASTMRYMAPGYGYWLHMTAPGTLFYPEGGQR